MAMLLLLGTMAHQRNRLLFRQLPEESQCELLSMVFDPAIFNVNAAVEEQLLQISLRIVLPRNLPEAAEQRFGRTKIGHPDIVTFLSKSTNQEPGC